MESYAIFGLFAFIVAMTLIGLPSRVNKLEHKVKKIDSRYRGETSMSKMFEELVGRECKITFCSGINSVKYTVLEIDEDWIKISSTNKKQQVKTELVRIDEINRVEIL